MVRVSCIRAQASVFRDPDSGFRVSKIETSLTATCEPSSPRLVFPVIGFRILGSGFQVPGSGFRVPSSGFRVSDSGFRVPSFGFRVPGSGLRVPGSGFQVSRSGFRVSGVEDRTPSVLDRSARERIGEARLSELRGSGSGVSGSGSRTFVCGCRNSGRYPNSGIGPKRPGPRHARRSRPGAPFRVSRIGFQVLGFRVSDFQLSGGYLSVLDHGTRDGVAFPGIGHRVSGSGSSGLGFSCVTPPTPLGPP